MYAHGSFVDLAQRTEFEARLLQTVHKIAEDKLEVIEDGWRRFAIVQSEWSLDEFREKRLRHTLDALAPLHREPLLGQLEPVQLFARMYVADTEPEPVEVDIDVIRRWLAGRTVAQDYVFTLRLIVVTRDGSAA